MKWTVPIFIAVLCISLILFTFFIDSEILIYFGNAVQIGSLILAALNVSMVRKLYAAGDEPRKAWGWLSTGLFLWIIAQLIGSYREMVLEELPYGDFSDVFWVTWLCSVFYRPDYFDSKFFKNRTPYCKQEKLHVDRNHQHFRFRGAFSLGNMARVKGPRTTSSNKTA